MTDSPTSKQELYDEAFVLLGQAQDLLERARAAHEKVYRLPVEPPARRDELAEFLRRKADGAGHEDAALFGLCAREIERAAQPPTDSRTADDELHLHAG